MPDRKELSVPVAPEQKMNFRNRSDEEDLPLPS